LWRRDAHYTIHGAARGAPPLLKLRVDARR
jgi:hypothetical protein